MSRTKNLKIELKPLAAQVRCAMFSLILIALFALRAVGQDGHTHAAQQQELTPEQKTLVQVVRDATERFKDVSVAEHEGYALQFGCVSGPDSGAMGLHYVNGALVNAGVLDLMHPQIVIYEPMADGSLKLLGADYLLFAAAWDAKKVGPPQLMGQLFHLFDAPNSFGLPAFYTLHVWAWKDNPNGAFVNWHPQVSCEHFAQASHL